MECVDDVAPRWCAAMCVVHRKIELVPFVLCERSPASHAIHGEVGTLAALSGLCLALLESAGS